MNDASDAAIITQPTTHTPDEDAPEAKWKKYAKLVAPHAALVLACCIYAIIGAAIFYSIESPYEDLTRDTSVGKLTTKRDQLLGQLWVNSHRKRFNHSRNDWMKASDKYINMYTEMLFNAFTTEFVRYNDVKATMLKHMEESMNRRLRNSSLPYALARKQSGAADDRPTKLWTKSSAVFFSATTMATIGYGNIVPATMRGRIVCVLFALIGAPLAIITIGDLGKFMSESTIWLYKQLKAIKSYTQSTSRRMIRRYYHKNNSVVTEVLEVERPNDNVGENMWDDIIDKTEVPVVLVFAVLLAYIALGAVMFCFIEGWTYIDSFYFCFITLTTVGFGDIVPEEHDYLILMLLYISVGLSVTTMCIDLVGIQYIQKIHYFGRKFKGTDWLSYIKRKRMLERAGMRGDEEMFRAFMRELEQQPQETKDPWEVDNVCLYTPPPESPLSLASSVEQRAMLYRRRQFTVSSWTASGPDISLPASVISTPPSVHLRWHMYNQMLLRPTHSGASTFASTPSGPYSCGASTLASRSSQHRRQFMYGRRLWYSPTDSVITFEFGPPSDVPCSPCPPDTPESVHKSAHPQPPDDRPPTPLSFLSETISDLFSLDSHSERCHELINRLHGHRAESPTSFRSFTPDSTASTNVDSETNARKLIYDGRETERPPSAESFASSIRSFESMFSNAGSETSVRTRQYVNATFRSPTVTSFESDSEQSLLSPEPEITIRTDMYARPTWHAPPESPKIFTFEPLFDLAAIAAMAKQTRRSGSCTDPFITIPPSPIGLVYLESWDTHDLWLEWSKRPYVHPPDLHVDAASSSDEELEPPNLLSPLASEFPITPTPVGDFTETNMGMFELCNADEIHQSATAAPTILTVAEVPVHSVHSDTVDTDTCLETLMAAPDSMLTEKIPPKMVGDNYCFVVDGEKVSVPDITAEDLFWRHTSRPEKYFYSKDLKAFKSINVTIVGGRVIHARLKSKVPPLLPPGAIKDPPPPPPPSKEKPIASKRSVASKKNIAGITNNNNNEKRVNQTENKRKFSGTQRSRSDSGSSQMSTDSIRKSRDGKIINRPRATGRKGRPPMSKSNSTEVDPTSEDLPLEDIYKVTRFYSFWSTCTNFHRIVTLITPAIAAAHPDFKKRIFIQFLWRNPRLEEKARVAQEFDPKQQRLLNFVK